MYTGSSSVGLGDGLTIPHSKRQLVMKYYTVPRNGRDLVNTVMNFRVP